MRESGILGKFEKESCGLGNDKGFRPPLEAISLGYDNLLYPFLMLVFGSVLSFVVLLGEYVKTSCNLQQVVVVQ